MSDLATALIHELERLETRSAAVVRRAVYATLEQFGVKVATLQKEARAIIGAELEARASASQRRVANLKVWADRVGELAAKVNEGPRAEVPKIRKLLDAKVAVDEISVQLGIERPYIRAVRDLDYARKAKQEYTERRKALPKRHRNRLERFKARLGWTSEPTKERLKQAGKGEEPARAHVAGGQHTNTFRWPIDQVRHLLTGPEYDAAKRLHDAHTGLRAESSETGLGYGGNPTKRPALTPHQQKCGRERHEFWRRLPSVFKVTATNFIFEEAWSGNSRALSRVEFGERFGMVDGAQQARGVSDGMIKALCNLLAQIVREFDGWVKAERRKVYAAMHEHRDVALYIADGDAKTAFGLLCKRLKVEHWIIYSCVNKMVEDVQAAMEKESKAA